MSRHEIQFEFFLNRKDKPFLFHSFCLSYLINGNVQLANATASSLSITYLYGNSNFILTFSRSKKIQIVRINMIFSKTLRSI